MPESKIYIRNHLDYESQMHTMELQQLLMVRKWEYLYTDYALKRFPLFICTNWIVQFIWITGNTKVESISNEESSTQEQVIDPSPVLYIAKYNRVIDTSQVLNKSEDEVPEEDSKPIPERYVIF